MRLYEKLQQYSKSEYYPLHMPGHKRQFEGNQIPYEIDITEIDGFDDLHHPEGIIKKAQKEAARIYGTRKSFYLINGSTSGIMIAISACVQPGEKILIAENCHRSVWNTVYVRGLKATILPVDWVGVPFGFGKSNIFGAVKAKRISELMDQDPSIKAVMITSPTYEGVVSPIQEISEVVHAHHACLIVDEAHGAHLPFVDNRKALIPFPESATKEGADIIIQSLHKTLPSLTQTGILHVCSERIDLHEVKRFYSIYQTSSPSYILMASIEECIHYMDTQGRDEMLCYSERLKQFWQKSTEWDQLWFLLPETKKMSKQVLIDPSKIVFGSRKGNSGRILMDWMRRDYKLECEMCTPEYVIAMTSLMDREEAFRRMEKAFGEINRRLKTDTSPVKIEKNLSIVPKDEGKGLQSASEWIPYEKSAGRILASHIGIYPPGIPFWHPGQKITEHMIGEIRTRLQEGFRFDGLEESEEAGLQYEIEVEK